MTDHIVSSGLGGCRVNAAVLGRNWPQKQGRGNMTCQNSESRMLRGARRGCWRQVPCPDAPSRSRGSRVIPEAEVIASRTRLDRRCEGISSAWHLRRASGRSPSLAGPDAAQPDQTDLPFGPAEGKWDDGGAPFSMCTGPRTAGACQCMSLPQRHDMA